MLNYCMILVIVCIIAISHLFPFINGQSFRSYNRLNSNNFNRGISSSSSSSSSFTPATFRTSRSSFNGRTNTVGSNGFSASTSQKPTFYLYRYDIEAIKNRPVTRPIHPMILSRRSLREMNGLPVKDNELASLFEAARWAPSHFNLQPWRFVFTKRDSPKWEEFLSVLDPGNRKWAKDAGVLMVVLSNKFQLRKGRKELIPSHSFDTGSAVYSMSLEGSARGLVVHPMGGFNREAASKMIGLDRMENKNDYQIEAMVAIGNRANLSSRNTEKTTSRHDIDKFVFDGALEEKIVVE